MPLAERVGKAFARRWGKHPDECVAEAYYQLVELFENYPHLYANGGDRAIVMFVRRGIRTYFKGWNGRDATESPVGYDQAGLSSDIGMMNYLFDIFPHENDAFQVFEWLKNGVNLMDVEIVEPRLRRTVIRIWRQVIGRVKRLEELNASQNKVRNGQDREDGDHPGERSGEEFVDCDGREWNQSQDADAPRPQGRVESKCPAI